MPPPTSGRNLTVTCAFILWTVLRCAADTPDLRSLLLHDRNQRLVDHLGTRYEVVHPFQIRKDWSRGLSTRLSEQDDDGTALHVPQTTLLIETFEYKLQLELTLNARLFAPTLVQLLYRDDETPHTVRQNPENCYYQATVRNHPDARAAFQTCHGIRGIIHLEERIFFIHPLVGNHSGRHPHLLYHYYSEEDFVCGSEKIWSSKHSEDGSTYHEERDDWHRNKYIETALVMDQPLFQMLQFSPSEALSAAAEIVNLVDLLYRPLNTSVSLVYLELWAEGRSRVSGAHMRDTLEDFRTYVERRISRFSVDTTHLLTGVTFGNEANGIAYLDSICTSEAIGLTVIHNTYQPHIIAFTLAHLIGHNLGMSHDKSGCVCLHPDGCVMENNMPIMGLQLFSQCSISDYHKTLARGHGACLYNMPAMRASICGNSILEEPEQCDCGTAEECRRSDPCCDPLTCRLVTHAQCSSGPCCRMCKLLSPDHLCRPSKGECDIPEFCDATSGKCPEDEFKRNGEMCSDGLGYCYQGECPVVKHQCQDIWGEGADSADPSCFERLNVQGTPNGNCGPDGRGGIAKCPAEHALCGFLQCSSGEKTPSGDAPVYFVVHRISSQGAMHECKARTFPIPELGEGLVKDGTKCGYQKLCLNQTCTSLKNLVSGKCPLEDSQNTCSGHGVCTNSNACFCEDGWKGEDCGTVDEDWRTGVLDEYYDASGAPSEYPHQYGQNELRMNPNLVITVIAASVVTGVGLVFVVAVLFFYRRT